MKYILFFVAVLPLVLGFQALVDTQASSVTNEIIAAIEASKKQMPCGFPDVGVPSLAPLKLNHENIDVKVLSGEFDNIRLDGLDDFKLVELNVNELMSEVVFKFNWQALHVNADYKMSATFLLKSSGKAKITLENLTAWGTIDYQSGKSESSVQLKSLADLHLTLGAVKTDISGLSSFGFINKKLNKVIEDKIMTAIKENSGRLNELNNSKVVGALNKLVGDRSLDDMLRILRGSGTCVPAKN